MFYKCVKFQQCPLRSIKIMGNIKVFASRQRHRRRRLHRRQHRQQRRRRSGHTTSTFFLRKTTSLKHKSCLSLTAVVTCGCRFNSTSGSLEAISYTSNEFCVWIIEFKEKMDIKLVLLFHIEYSPECKNDYIKVLFGLYLLTVFVRLWSYMS